MDQNAAPDSPEREDQFSEGQEDRVVGKRRGEKKRTRRAKRELRNRKERGGRREENQVSAPSARSGNPTKPQESGTTQVYEMASPARLKKRHVIAFLSFLLMVLLPAGTVVGYLYGVAKDQYASYAGFAVRSEEVSSGIEILGGITELSGTSSTDPEILYKFIQGRQMVEAVNDRLNLASIYVNPEDPVFGLKEGASAEEIQAYWQRVVKIFFDTRSGLIELRVVAFDPQEAQAVAQAVMDESTKIINALTAIAREDTTRYAKEELDRAIERLKEARQAINAFRARTQIVDPLADTQGRLGLLNNLQTQLATALIELDMIRQTARGTDPRIKQGELRVEVIRKQIVEERNRFGSEQETGDDTYSRLVGEYEALAVDLEFANQSYLSALAAYDTALAEAQRKSRYLAAFVQPTLAETPEYPQRLLLSSLIGAALLLCWTIAMLIYYSVRDRR